MGNNDNDITVLIKKSQRGDAAAMEELLRAAYTPVYYQCRRFLKTGADAEDMTQEVLLLLYTKLDTLKEPAAFWGWLGRLTANRCKNALTRTHADLPILEDEEGNSVLDAIESGDRTAVSEEAFDNAETARMIGGIVDALPEAQRDCVLLYYYDEMSVKEIAGVTGVAENTVKSRLNYARKTIKENVLDYEKKQGIRLHSLAPVPLLYYFLHMDAQACADAGKAEQAVSKVMGQAAAASAAPLSGPAAHPAATTAAHALQGISIKTAAVAAAGLLLIGGTAAGIVTALNHGKEEAAEVYAPIETGTPDGGDAVADTAEPEKTEEPAAAREGPLFPEEALAALPYTGDTGQCAMTMEQAEAFAGALDSCIAESREEGYDVPFCRAALFDAGNGIPALFVAWGADAGYGDDSGGLADLWDIVEGNPPQSENYYYTVSAEIKSQTAQYVSVIQTQEIYLGGIRESESRYYNFRTDTGEALLLTDILEGTADQITEQIADAVAIADPYTEETGALDNIRGRDIGEFDFYISDGHIHLSFDTYDLYGTSYGGDPPVEVELPAELRAEWR